MRVAIAMGVAAGPAGAATGGGAVVAVAVGGACVEVGAPGASVGGIAVAVAVAVDGGRFVAAACGAVVRVNPTTATSMATFFI